jgi:hypothetical protein
VPALPSAHRPSPAPPSGRHPRSPLAAAVPAPPPAPTR